MSSKVPKNKYKFAHTPKEQMGMGDFTGKGLTAKYGRLRQSYLLPGINPKNKNSPPNQLA